MSDKRQNMPICLLNLLCYVKKTIGKDEGKIGFDYSRDRYLHHKQFKKVTI